MKTRNLMMICLVVGVVLLAGTSRAYAVSVNLIGAFENMVDVDSNINNGLGNYSHEIDRTTVFSVSVGTVTISGNIDVSNLAPGSFLQIGLIDKEQADMALEYFKTPAFMFNNSATLTFFENNTARLIDRINRHDADDGYVYDPIQSDPIVNTGSSPDKLSFILEINGIGTMRASLDDGFLWTSLDYGRRNWYDEIDYDQANPGVWSNTELQSGSYLIAQMFVDTGNMENPVSANYNVTGVPEPATVALLGLGGLFLRRRRRA